MEFTAEMIAGYLGGDVVGDKGATVSTLAKIEEGVPGALSFLSNPKYEPYLYTTDASIVIVNRSLEPKGPVKATMVRVDDAYGCFARLLQLYESSKPQKTGISPQASVSPTAKLGEGCYVGEFAVVGDNVTLGDNCKIYPQVYLGDNVRIGDNVRLYAGVKIYEDCVIGNNVSVHAGSVIGADGFGWAPDVDGVFHRIPQLGNVVIEDNVDIGANACIDRATMGSTVIRAGVKLDNLIQVGHNVAIGENTVCAALTGIAGSSKLGRNCMVAGQVGIAGHLHVGDRVTIGSKSGVSNNIADGETYMGYPALPVSKFHRINAVYRNLVPLSADVHQLKKQVKQILDAEE